MLRRGGSGRSRGDAEVSFDLPQALEHLLRVVGSVVRRLLRCPEHEFVELLRHSGVAHARSGHRFRGVLESDLHGLLALVGLLTHEHLVQHDAEGVDVAAGVGGSAGDEFGGEVGDRPEQLLSGRGVRGGRSREPEVADLYATVFGEEDVLGLHVAVHDPGTMRGRETGQDRIHDGDGLRDREALLLAEELAQRDAGQILHHEVGQLAVLALVEHVHDVGSASRAAALASWMNRLWKAESSLRCACITLRAMRRSRRRSVATYTVAIPPRAMRARTR